VFWTFDDSILHPPNPNPDKVAAPVIVAVPSDSGDDCHRNIHHVSANRAKKLFDEHAAPFEQRLVVCMNGITSPFDWIMLETLCAQTGVP
jgi:hypothetical protein